MGKKLEEAGYPAMSSAVRPMAIAPDEKTLFFQVSFFHGFVEFDLEKEKVTRVAELPLSDKAKALSREDYLLDSAHHGLAINPQGTKLCVAGTMSDYGAIVNRSDLSYKLISPITKSYWSTNTHDGRHCLISGSGDDALFVISYATAQKLAKIPVGDHPQRVRNGVARVDIYPQRGTGEAFRFAVTGKGTRYACAAKGARDLRLSSCLVRLVSRGATVAQSERIVRGVKGFKVTVKPTTSPLPARATLVATGVDSLGRARTVRRKVSVRT
jgi:hypothetical protein